MAQLRARGGLGHCVVVSAPASAPLGERYAAMCLACSIGGEARQAGGQAGSAPHLTWTQAGLGHGGWPLGSDSCTACPIAIALRMHAHLGGCTPQGAICMHPACLWHVPKLAVLVVMMMISCGAAVASSLPACLCTCLLLSPRAAERVRDEGGHALVVVDDVKPLGDTWEHLIQGLAGE